MIRALSLSLAFIATTAVLAPARAYGQAADATAAAEAYNSGEYDRAATLFEQAYADAPDAALLFGWAQSERMRGACAHALDLYDKLLATAELSGRQREAVQLARSQPCTSTSSPESDDQNGEPDAEPAPQQAVEAPIQQPTPPSPEPSRWYHDRLGHAMLGTGIVAAAAAGVLFPRSSETAANAGDQPSLPEVQAMFSRARRDRAIAIGAAAAGGVLIVGAVVRYATGNSPRREAPVQVGAAPSPGGATVVLTGRF